MYSMLLANCKIGGSIASGQKVTQLVAKLMFSWPHGRGIVSLLQLLCYPGDIRNPRPSVTKETFCEPRCRNVIWHRLQKAHYMHPGAATYCKPDPTHCLCFYQVVALLKSNVKGNARRRKRRTEFESRIILRMPRCLGCAGVEERSEPNLQRTHFEPEKSFAVLPAAPSRCSDCVACLYACRISVISTNAVSRAIGPQIGSDRVK